MRPVSEEQRRCRAVSAPTQRAAAFLRFFCVVRQLQPAAGMRLPHALKNLKNTRSRCEDFHVTGY
jgi:hypothetical protein